MILNRLYELAQREGLADDPSVEPAPIACLINVGRDGRYLGLQDVRPDVPVPSKKKGAPPKTRKGKGKTEDVPKRPVLIDPQSPRGWKTNDPACNGKERPAVFLADTLARVLPLHPLIQAADRDKFAAQRSTFWRFLNHVAAATADEALAAGAKFGQWLVDDPAAADRLAADIEAHGLSISDLCALAYEPDNGRLIFHRPAIRTWWRQFYTEDFLAQQVGVTRGFCQVTRKDAPIAESIKSRIGGLISIGCRADAYLVTGIPASSSFGIDSVACAMVSDEAVDAYVRALNALIGNHIPGCVRTSLTVRGTMFLFWTREKQTDFDIAGLLESADPQQVVALLESPQTGRQHAAINGTDFYCLMLSGNSARVVVRDYLETSLPIVRENIRRWFADLRIYDVITSEAKASFPLWMLAAATARDASDVPSDLQVQLMRAAIKNQPVPDHVLAACLVRLRVEGESAFRAHRMGLIKLILNRFHRKGDPMTESLDPTRKSVAYVCGQLLAVFERLQYFALGDVNASVVDRFYGTASTAPALVFPRLFKLAEQHLSKLQGEKPGVAVNMQKEIEAVSVKLNGFPSQISLADQGEFALGFYHRRAEYRAASLEKKQRNAEKEGAAEALAH